MSTDHWVLTGILVIGYLLLLFTAGLVTFRKGHFVLLVVGMVLPFLWLIGALLPARSRFESTA